MTDAYPLSWPTAWPRTAAEKRLSRKSRRAHALLSDRQREQFLRLV